MERPVSLELETEIQTFYAWEVPGKSISIHLDFEVVDQVLSEVMQGFGAVPKRGAEVGGLLLGTIREGSQPIVHIQDFEPVLCEHARGPSYLLSAADDERLTAAVEKWRIRPSGRKIQVVGFYRSHTREGLGLNEEDLDLFEKRFAEPGQVFLLVKPFATRASVGAFFFREDGGMRSESSYQEFPFRRRDLGGGTAVPPAEYPELDLPQPDRITSLSLVEDPPPAVTSPKLKRNVWIPLSFIFLLVGVMLGFQAAISLRPVGSATAAHDPYALLLTAAKSNDTVNLRWDRQAPAILKARSGLLTITDGAYNKTLELDQSQLQNGTVIYRFLTSHVTFRLEVFSRDRASVVESLEFHTDVGAAPSPPEASPAKAK